MEIVFTATRQHRRITPPSMLGLLITEWLGICGMGIEDRIYQIQAVDPDEPTASWFTVTTHHDTLGPCFIASVRAPLRDEGYAIWRVRISHARECMEKIVAMCASAEMVANQNLESGRTQERLALLYEILRGQDFTDADITHEIASDATFADAEMLTTCLRHLSHRGAYLTFLPEGSGDGSSGFYGWNTSFRDHMRILAETRREELMGLPPMEIGDFVRRLSMDEEYMLEQLEGLQVQMVDRGPEVRIPKDFLSLIQPILEHFVGRAAAAGILVKVGDSTYGILGGIWRVVVDKYATALGLLHAIQADRVAPTASATAPEPPLTRDAEIALRLGDARDRLARFHAGVANDRPLIDAAEDVVWELEERLEMARKALQALTGPHSEDEPYLAAILREIHDLKTEQAALVSAVKDAASADISQFERKAREMGVEPEVYFAALEAALKGRRPS